MAAPGVYPEEVEAEVSKRRGFSATLPGDLLGQGAAGFGLTVALVFIALCQF